jgi:hypothetical protein
VTSKRPHKQPETANPTMTIITDGLDHVNDKKSYRISQPYPQTQCYQGFTDRPLNDGSPIGTGVQAEIYPSDLLRRPEMDELDLAYRVVWVGNDAS